MATKKEFLSYDQQINFLRQKGMTIKDHKAAEQYLKHYGYFALVTGYKGLLKDSHGNYRKGCTIEDLVMLYQFDENLRALTLRYLLHIEAHMRSVFSYAFCEEYGDSQNAYLRPENYDYNERTAGIIEGMIKRTLEPIVHKETDHVYVEHYKNKYHNLPLWVLVSTLSFGQLAKFYQYMKPQLKQKICREFGGIEPEHLRSNLDLLTDFRNVCAHNDRLFTHRSDGAGYSAMMRAMKRVMMREEYEKFESELYDLIETTAADSPLVEEWELRKAMGL